MTSTQFVDPNSPTSGMDAVSAMYTSPEQEEKMRKASVANQRILAVADALRHVGNIYHTVKYAPSQQFTNPATEEYDRYQKGKAVRDAANARYYSYQQAKAAQDAKQRQWEATFAYNAAKDAATAAALADYRDRIIKERGRIADQNHALNRDRATAQQERWKRQDEETKRYHNITAGQRSESLKMQRERTNAYVNRAKSGGGSGVAPLDTPKGQITPNGRSYSNQLLQMFDYAKSKGYVQESDVAKRLREMGFGNDQSDNVKRQMVMDLLRTNPDMGDYASDRLGWTYGGGTSASDWEQYAEEEDNWDDYLDD